MGEKHVVLSVCNVTSLHYEIYNFCAPDSIIVNFWCAPIDQRFSIIDNRSTVLAPFCAPLGTLIGYSVHRTCPVRITFFPYWNGLSCNVHCT